MVIITQNDPKRNTSFSRLLKSVRVPTVARSLPAVVKGCFVAHCALCGLACILHRTALQSSTRWAVKEKGICEL
jgi:hypothetical protein